MARSVNLNLAKGRRQNAYIENQIIFFNKYIIEID